MKRTHVRVMHRWTDEQTQTLLEQIRDALADGNVKFEQPTSQKFYSTHCQHSVLNGIPWNIMKGKMRYLKALYMKAISWREQVGSELFKSDKAHVEARIKTICPYYNILNDIFEPMLPADPIRLTDKDFNKFLLPKQTCTEIDISMEATELDDSELESLRNEVIPRIKNEADDRSITYEESPKRSTSKRKRFNQIPVQAAHEPVEETTDFESEFELECAKFAFECKKFNFEMKYRDDKEAMLRTQLNFEKEKLEFEKRKFFEDQRLRKYEIDKQFEVKKLEIEKDERLQRLELEMKYRYKPIDEVVEYGERSEYS